MANIFPKKKIEEKKIQKSINQFIWAKTHEKLPATELHQKRINGGLNLTNVIAKTNAHYDHTLLTNYLQHNTEIGKMTHYLVGHSLNKIKKTPKGPHKERLNPT